MSQNELNPIVIISSASLRPLIALIPTHLPAFNMKWRRGEENNEKAGQDLIFILKGVVPVEQMTGMMEHKVLMIVWVPMMTVRYAV